MFIICKQLNGPVLKSLKPSCLGRNRKKKIGRAGSGPKFCISLWARLAADRNFFLYFGPGRAEIAVMRKGLCPGLRNPGHADLYAASFTISE